MAFAMISCFVYKINWGVRRNLTPLAFSWEQRKLGDVVQGPLVVLVDAGLARVALVEHDERQLEAPEHLLVGGREDGGDEDDAVHLVFSPNRRRKPTSAGLVVVLLARGAGSRPR